MLVLTHQTILNIQLGGDHEEGGGGDPDNEEKKLFTAPLNGKH